MCVHIEVQSPSQLHDTQSFYKQNSPRQRTTEEDEEEEGKDLALQYVLVLKAGSGPEGGS